MRDRTTCAGHSRVLRGNPCGSVRLSAAFPASLQLLHADSEVPHRAGWFAHKQIPCCANLLRLPPHSDAQLQHLAPGSKFGLEPSSNTGHGLATKHGARDSLPRARQAICTDSAINPL